MSTGVVSGIWRYPVMGMQGENLGGARVNIEGVEGDHAYVLRDRLSGRILDPRNLARAWGETMALPSMIDLKAELHEGSDGDPELRVRLPGGEVRYSKDGDLDGVVSEFLGRRVELLKYPRVVETRVLSGKALHLLTTASLRAIATFYPEGQFDVRRFRPNLFVRIDGSEDFVEEGWVGKTLHVGESVRLRVEKPCIRCNVTTMKQDDVVDDPRIFSTIERANEKRLGVLCSVLSPGTVFTGDPISVS